MKNQINKFQKHAKIQKLKISVLPTLKKLKAFGFTEKLQEENPPVLSNPRNLKVLEILKIFEENFQSPRFQKLKISVLSTSDRKLKVRR